MNLMTIPPLSGADPSSDSVVTSSAESVSWGFARIVKFQPDLDLSYHRRMRIKIGPSARIDGRVQNSQTFLWCSPDTGPLARDFLQEETRARRTFSLSGGAGITWKKASSNRTLARGRYSRWTGKSCVRRTCRTACRI